MARCNLNDKVKFKLTDAGKQYLANYLKEQRNKYGCDASACYQPDPLGHLTLHLHDLMATFGPGMQMGFPQLIVENILIFCGE